MWAGGICFADLCPKVTTQKNEKTETHFCVLAMLFGGMGVLFQKASPEKFLSNTLQQFLQVILGVFINIIAEAAGHFHGFFLAVDQLLQLLSA